MDKKFTVLVVLLAILLVLMLLAFAERRGWIGGPPSVSGAELAEDLSAPSTAAETAEPDGEKGSVLVSGLGVDLFEVFAADGETKVGFTRTNQPLEVPAGSYVVVLNGSRGTASVSSGERTFVSSGAVFVGGTGVNLYEIYGGDGEKLQFKSTGQMTELLPGTYEVALHGIRQSVEVEAGGQTELATGRLTVAGDGGKLYEVYDSEGTRKLDFTSTGREIELFPGAYLVRSAAGQQQATVVAGQLTTVEL